MQTLRTQRLELLEKRFTNGRKWVDAGIASPDLVIEAEIDFLLTKAEYAKGDLGATAGASGVTVIRNGQLVDGTGAAATPDGVVIAEDGVIRYAGPAAGAPETAEPQQVIDAQGGTIMPGLVAAGRKHPNHTGGLTMALELVSPSS